MEEEIKNFVVNYIEKKGKLPLDIKLDEFNYIDSGYIDSMGIIKFVIVLEENFDIEISEEDMMSSDFRTIGGLCEMLKEKCKCKKS